MYSNVLFSLSHGVCFQFETGPLCLGTFPEGTMTMPKISLVPYLTPFAMAGAPLVR